jgi:integrase
MNLTHPWGLVGRSPIMGRTPKLSAYVLTLSAHGYCEIIHLIVISCMISLAFWSIPRTISAESSFLYVFARGLGMNAQLKPIDKTRILARSEVADVISDLRRKKRSINTRQNLVVFRLAACCGLRVSEIAGVRLCDVQVTGRKPHIKVPKAIAKRGKARTVPLWWDAATLADLQTWKAERTKQGAKQADPFVCSQSKATTGKPLITRNLQNRWRNAIKVLGPERVKVLSIHCGRHSFCSHALAGGRTIADVRDAAGHANISTTSIYLHAVTDDDEAVGNLFDFPDRNSRGTHTQHES